ncbi:MAG TPA: hypothetical protein VG994_02625 [Steroidobacteraceae bacterium]|nr:hypothetical protein [Steroidobacteraceae bacterium]
MVSNATGIEVGLLAGRYPGRVGHLYSPKGERGPWIEIPYALDNGVYGAHSRGVEWNEAEWHRLLLWAVMSGIMPLWAVVRDAIGNREATIAYWKQYAPAVRARGFRPAFVAQDGMTFDDVPDSECIVFLGGSPKTNWKNEAIGPWCARFPGRVHVGRVNGWDRLVSCYRAGAISVDGTGWFHKSNSKNQSQFNDLNKFLRETSAAKAAA